MKKTKLGNILKIKHGFAFKSEHYVDKSQYALVTLANISGNNDFQFNHDKTTFYGSDFPGEFKLKPGDLIMPLTEQVVGLLGNSAFVPPKDNIQFVLNQRVGKVIPFEDRADKYYLHYLLSTDTVREQLEYRASGTRQRNISPDDIYDVTVYIPKLKKQRAIGMVLYTLENKININRRINDNLQQMARMTYMHLFFNKKHNGKLGDIIIEQPKSNIQVTDAKASMGEIPFFTSGDAVLSCSSPLVDGRNCFLNTGGNAGIKFYVGETAYSTDTWCITSKDDFADYLYLLLDALKPEISKKFFQGTGLKHLQKALLKDRSIYIPSRKEREYFNAMVMPWLSMISDNIKESQQLMTLRDWLLPMLMNGQATVDD